LKSINKKLAVKRNKSEAVSTGGIFLGDNGNDFYEGTVETEGFYKGYRVCYKAVQAIVSDFDIVDRDDILCVTYAPSQEHTLTTATGRLA